MQVQRNVYVHMHVHVVLITRKSSSIGLGPPPARAFSPSFTISSGELEPKEQAKQGSQGVKTNYKVGVTV